MGGFSPVNSKLPFFMPTDSFEKLLDRAAAWYGIDDGFWDIFGNRRPQFGERPR